MRASVGVINECRGTTDSVRRPWLLLLLPVAARRCCCVRLNFSYSENLDMSVGTSMPVTGDFTWKYGVSIPSIAPSVRSRQADGHRGGGS